MIDEELTPATSQSPPCALLDIGMLSKNGDLHSLPQHTKLELLNHTPDPKFNYPTKYVHGCNRRFKPEWLKNHSWLHYSPSEDGVYCKACALFAPADIRRQTLGILVSKPFSLWTKQSSVFLSHEQNQYHQDSMTRMMAFKDSCSVPTRTISSMLNKEREEQITRNTTVIKSLLECVCFCTKQGLPFRSHRDDYTAVTTDNTNSGLRLMTYCKNI